MEVIATKKLDFKAVGNIRFTFSKSWSGRKTDKHEYVYVGDVSIHQDTDVSITDEQEKELMEGIMEKSDVLLDTRSGKYYTTRGNKLTQISHSSFDDLTE